MGESSGIVKDVISNYLSDIKVWPDGTYDKGSAWNEYVGNGEIDNKRVEELKRIMWNEEAIIHELRTGKTVLPKGPHPMLQLLNNLKSDDEKAGRVRDACDAWHEGLHTLHGLWDFDAKKEARKKDDIVMKYLLREGFPKRFRCPHRGCDKLYKRRGDFENHLQKGCQRVKRGKR